MNDLAMSIEPPHTDTELVHESAACPACGEREMDLLIWTDDAVECQRCGMVYEP